MADGSLSHVPLLEKREPRNWFSRARGIIALAVLTPFTVLAVVSTPAVREGSWGDMQLETLGWMVFVAGAAFRLWATLYIGGRKGSEVATTGPYSLCRNPLYLGTFLMTLAVALLIHSLTFGVGLVLATAAYYAATVPAEEHRLRARHGASYVEYCQRVPRFWPRLSSFTTPSQIQVDVRCLAIECRRALRWVWIPIACEVLVNLRTEAWWPHLLMLP